MSQDEVETSPPVERLHPLTVVTQAWILLVGAVWVGVQSVLRGEFSISNIGWQLWVFLAVLLIQLVQGIGKAWFTRFAATDNHFKIETKFIWQSSKRITFNKIQSVNVSQPFAARLLGLARLTIEVGANEDYTVEFLSKARAEELRSYLLARSSEAKIDAPEAAQKSGLPEDTEPGELPLDTEPTPAISVQPEQEGAALVKASPLRLLFAGIASFYFLVAMLIALGTLWAALSGGMWAVFFTAFFAIGAALYRTVVLNWNFTLFRTPSGVRLTRGLTALHTRNIPVHRIQGLAITQGLLWRPFGFYRVQVAVLGGLSSGESENVASPELLPVGTWEDVQQVLTAVWPSVDPAALVWEPQPEKAKWLTPLSFRYRGWTLTPDLIASRRGWLLRRIDLVPYARMQSAGLRAGPLQRRLGLAVVSPHISMGPVHADAGHLPESDAVSLLHEISERARQARHEA